MATIEKRLKCAVDDIDFAMEFPGALAADHRNALSLARSSVDAVRSALAAKRAANQSLGAPERVDGDPGF